jgi:hypothetical protein
MNRVRSWERQKAQAVQELLVAFPGLSPRLLNCLRSEYMFEPHGLAAIKAASDAELLTIRNFGKVMLREFRSAWPEPVRAVPLTPPALPCTERHGPLSWVGG